MVEWLASLWAVQNGDTPSVLVTITETRGSVPREAGAKMVVTEDVTFGTIGGGQLEYEALRLARAMLAGSEPAVPQLRRFGLGPSLGQCCGGTAQILFEPMSGRPEPWQAALRELVERGEPAVLVTALGTDAAGKLVVTSQGAVGRLRDERREAEASAVARAMLEGADAAVRLDVGEQGAALLFERVRSESLHVVLFGAGHVGKALVRILGELPCRVAWIDGRAEQFPRDVPPNVTVECTEMPPYAVERAPSSAAFLVMTHSHALDLTLCDKILRRGDFSYFGLIGSATKRAKFVKRFKARGLADDVIERMVCPIGIPGLPGKHPGEIAVAIAAQLLMLQGESARSGAQVSGRRAS